jgi:hypothetical protein
MEIPPQAGEHLETGPVVALAQRVKEGSGASRAEPKTQAIVGS